MLAKRGDDIALVHYLGAEHRLIILFTTPHFQVSREVAIARAPLNRLIHEFRFAIEQASEDLDRIAITLHRLLIAPIADLIAEIGITALLLAPAGALRYLPFAALHDGKSFLIERVALVMVTEAAISVTIPPSPTQWRVAGFGVARTVPGYRPLPAVAHELRRIIDDPEIASDPSTPRGIFPGHIHLDDAFTRARLAAALDNYAVIHIASHFRFDPVNEGGSHLLLGDGAVLTLDGMRDASFRFGSTALVALSACETAMGGPGDETAGAEIEGLGALIRRRGAGAVLASLWPVADAGTPALMEAFYRALRAGLGLAEALRTAQYTLLVGPDPSLRHPVNWAAFILLGDAA